MTGSVLRPVLSGVATVHCIHDRQKRQVNTLRQVAELGLTAGIVYNTKQHRLYKCACCENLFFDPSDEPRYCGPCTRNPQAFPLGGTLDETGRSYRMKVYECRNSACSLGFAKDPGRFTGGMTAEQKTLVTGEPVDSLKKGVDYGDGICPNCGREGKAV